MDKPAGLTSHDVVSRVRRALGTRAVGHTGTLDPFATGLMVVLVGRATRLARFVEGQPKTYLATARLGAATTTDDLTGEVIEGGWTGEPPARAVVEGVLRDLTGAGRQRPPAYSAKHVAGERAYARARRGEVVELAEVPIVVHGLELVRYDFPELQFRATVSAGTYVRALGRDLGERLGTQAHLTVLRREAIAPLRVDEAVPLEGVTPAGLLPPLAVLPFLPRLAVSPEQARAIGHGQAVRIEGAPAGGATPVAAVAPDGGLVAVGRVEAEAFRPEVVLEAAP